MMENLAWKRGKRKLKTHYGNNEYYKYYCQNTVKRNRVLQITFSTILKEYFTAMNHEVARYGKQIHMPRRLGKISFGMYKKKIKLTPEGELDKRNLAVDWAETKKLWMEDKQMMDEKRLIYFINEHSDGYTYKVKWEKTKTNAKNTKYYKFKPLRELSSLPNKYLKQGIKLNYYEL